MTLTDGTKGSQGRRHELGTFLRTRRKMRSPEEAGLPQRARRHRPGLSRDEVAFLAGISADWYGRLEGGLDIAPSAATLMAVARVLHLEPAEIEYLFELAGVYPPKFQQSHESDIPTALETLILTSDSVGLALFDEYVTPLAWNRVADSMYRITPFTTPLERNAIVRMADPFVIYYIGSDYELVMRRVVGVFRRAFDLSPTPFAQEVYSRAREYPKFREYWDDHVVADETTIGPGPHVRQHPAVGTFSMFSTDVHLLRQQTWLRVTAPADQESAEKFKILHELGTAFR